MPPSVSRKLLYFVHLLVLTSFIFQALAPIAVTAARLAASDTRPLSQEEPPAEPIDESYSGLEEFPLEPPTAPSEDLVDNTEPPIGTSEHVQTALPPLVDDEISPQPMAPLADEPGFDVPVQVDVSQDRYVMAIGETTQVSLTVYPTMGQEPTAVQITLTSSSNLISIANSSVNSWSVPPLQEGDHFVQRVDLQIAAEELPPSGSVITFTVETGAPNFRSITWTSWLGLLPESAPPSTEPMTATPHITDIVNVSVVSDIQQSDYGAVLQHSNAMGKTKFLLLAAPGAVPTGTQFTYTELTPQAAPAPSSVPVRDDLLNPLYLPSVKSDNQFVVASSEISSVAPITTIDGVEIYSMWHLTATQADGSGVNHFDQPILLMLSVDEWVGAGLDMDAVQLVTRQDDSQPWQTQPARFDEKRQIWVTSVQHFSTFALGTGLGSGFDMLPSMTGFAEGGYTGAVTYNYPLEAPSGLGGLNPNLSLSYSSNVPDNVAMNTDYNDSKIQASVVGYGWEIGGISYIARVQIPSRPDEEYYTMVIDGQRVDIVGAQTDTATGYRTNPELFADIKYAETTTTSIWTVTLPNGTVYTFGGIRADANLSDADVTMVIATTSSSRALKFERWMLTKVRDTSGNYMEYSYKTERRAASGTCSASEWYSSSIVLDNVRWSGNSTSNPVVTPKLQMRFVYESNRLDVVGQSLQFSSSFCRQLKVTSKRLASVVVEVFEANGTTAHMIRSYTLAQDIDDETDRMNDGEDGNEYKHQLLRSITQKGNDGSSTLHTTSFAYRNYFHDGGPTVNNIRLRQVVTGYGAIVRYSYSWVNTANCGPEPEQYICFDSFWPVTTRAVFNGVKEGGTSENPTGFNSWTSTTFSYSTARYVNHAVSPTGQNFTNVGEWLGVTWSEERSYEATNTQVYPPVNSFRLVRNQYYRDWAGSPLPDPRKGKIYLQKIYSGPATGQLLFSQTAYTWSSINVNTGNPYSAAPEIDQITWLRQDIKDEWNDGVGTRTKYYYDTNFQNAHQYGNVTRIDEYSHDQPGVSDTVLNATDLTTTDIGAIAEITDAEWQSRLNNSQITLKRRTIIEYIPEGVDADNYYIVSRPARKRVGTYNTSTNVFTCYAENRYIYDNGGTDWRTSPTLGRLIRSQTALEACSISDTIADANADWAVSINGYDTWGNQTSVTTKGPVDNILNTTFDEIYYLFPTKQTIAQFTSFEYSETAQYYGVNLSMSVAANGWNGARFAWGKLAEHCTVNDICTFQSYDRHGRPERRWERVAPGATLVDANASIFWDYRMPIAQQPTYRVTEWRAPRCFGNFVRRHYNGLGQLHMEQMPYQDWEENYDGCGAADGLGSEIRINYAYNALGKVLYVSVPQAIARSNMSDYAIDWGSIDKTTTTYDPLGRIFDTKAFNGETTITRYGGRITSVAALGRNGETHRYLSWQMVDGLGYPRLLRVYEVNNGVSNARAQVMLTSNVMGNTTQVILPGGVGTTTIGYNLVGQKTSHNDDDLGVWNYTYDRQGKLISQKDGRGQYACFYYDKLGRLVVKSLINDASCPASGGGAPPNDEPPVNVRRRIVYTYDTGGGVNRGQLISEESYQYANSSATGFNYRHQFVYNEKGLVLSDKMYIGKPDDLMNSTFGWTTTFAYDSYNRPLAVEYPGYSRVRTDYNSMGLPKSLCDANASYQCTTAPMLVDGVNYNVSGQITSMNFPASPGSSRTYSYYGWSTLNGNSNGRLHQISMTEGGSERLKLEYLYDSFGNITTLKEGISTENMSYDYRNRLTEAYGLVNAWDSDKARPTQIEGKGIVYSRPMAPSAVGNHAFTYDANGNMITRQFDDQNGVERNQTLTWDRENHLVQVDGYGYKGLLRTEDYLYTSAGVRLRKETGGGMTYYYPNQYFRAASDGAVVRYYFFGNMRIAERHHVGDGAATLYYRQGDQVDSARYTTPSTVAGQTRHYTAYGDQRPNDVWTQLDTGYRYAGQMEDGTGLVYMNARYYDPNIGLFISPDTIIPDPSNVLDYNRYMYGRGNPVSNNDPTGHCAVDGSGNITKSDCTVDDFQALNWDQRLGWLDAFVREEYLDDWFVDIRGAIGVLSSDPDYANMDGWAAYMDAAILQAINDGMRLQEGMSAIGSGGTHGGAAWQTFFSGLRSGMAGSDINGLIQLRLAGEQGGVNYARTLPETQTRYALESDRAQIKVDLFVVGADVYRSFGQWCRGFSSCNLAVTDPRESTQTWLIRDILAPMPNWVAPILDSFNKYPWQIHN